MSSKYFAYFEFVFQLHLKIKKSAKQTNRTEQPAWINHGPLPRKNEKYAVIEVPTYVCARVCFKFMSETKGLS